MCLDGVVFASVVAWFFDQFHISVVCNLSIYGYVKTVREPEDSFPLACNDNLLSLMTIKIKEKFDKYW